MHPRASSSRTRQASKTPLPAAPNSSGTVSPSRPEARSAAYDDSGNVSCSSQEGGLGLDRSRDLAHPLLQGALVGVEVEPDHMNRPPVTSSTVPVM